MNGISSSPLSLPLPSFGERSVLKCLSYTRSSPTLNKWSEKKIYWETNALARQSTCNQWLRVLHRGEDSVKRKFEPLTYSIWRGGFFLENLERFPWGVVAELTLTKWKSEGGSLRQRSCQSLWQSCCFLTLTHRIPNFREIWQIALIFNFHLWIILGTEERKISTPSSLLYSAPLPHKPVLCWAGKSYSMHTYLAHSLNFEIGYNGSTLFLHFLKLRNSEIQQEYLLNIQLLSLLGDNL